MSITASFALAASLLVAPNWGPTGPTQTERLKELLSDSTGTHGFYVREFGGSVKAAYNQNKTFEPASSIKVLAHLYAVRKIELGHNRVADELPVYNEGVCTVRKKEPLSRALKLMMQVSDNDRTRSVVDFFGRSKINRYIASLGLSDLEWKRAMPCEVETQDMNVRNEMTLVASGKLYEGAYNGKFIHEAGNRQTLWELMAGHIHHGTIAQELTSAGISADAQKAYKARVAGASKGGWWPDKGRASDLGWIRLPHCIDGHVQYKTFFYGFFIDNGQADNLAGDGPVGQASNEVRPELVREQIRTSVRGWEACASAPAFAPADDDPRPSKQSTPEFQSL
jgi:hypothetical protein